MFVVLCYNSPRKLKNEGKAFWAKGNRMCKVRVERPELGRRKAGIHYGWEQNAFRWSQIYMGVARRNPNLALHKANNPYVFFQHLFRGDVNIFKG